MGYFYTMRRLRLVLVLVIFASMYCEVLEAQTYVEKGDLNNDGKPDIWQYFENGNVVKREGDLNFDGIVDVTIEFKNGVEITRQDTNFDGNIDVWSNIPSDLMDERGAKIEKDTNYDGKVDMTVYALRESARIEKDTNHDGKIDYWEYSKKDKLTNKFKLIRLEVDSDFDEVVDLVEE